MAPVRSIFIGHFYEALQAVHAHTELTAVIGEKGKFPKDMEVFCAKNELPLTLVQDTKELVAFWASHQEFHGRIIISAGCGILFSQQIIDSSALIVNFHPGDIFTCRGRHPLPFAIMKKLPQMAISAHVINSEKIDAGPLIAQTFLPIDYKASYAANERMLLRILPGFVASVVALLECNTFHAWDWFNVFPTPYNTRLDKEILTRITGAEVIGAL
jgi:methionyl-tRNA formyltransferase